MMRDVFGLRQEIASILQAASLEELEALRRLVDREPRHPYRPVSREHEAESRDIRERLYRNPPFLYGTTRHKASPPGNYLYRVTSVDSILKMMIPLPDGSEPSLEQVPSQRTMTLFEPIGRSKSEVFRSLKDECGGRFIRLDRHLSGSLRGRRSGTWWTSRKVSPNNVFNERLILGICDTLVRPVVLRLSLARLNQEMRRTPDDVGPLPTWPRLPLEVDAFDCPVFDAQRAGSADPQALDGEPNRGRTIDLSEFPSLLEGVDEYVVHNVPVEAVEIVPGPFSVDDCDLEDRIEARRQIDTRASAFWEAIRAFHADRLSRVQGAVL